MNDTTTPDSVGVADDLTIDQLHRVTLCTDGGIGGRGSTTVAYLTPQAAAEVTDLILAKRRA